MKNHLLTLGALALASTVSAQVIVPDDQPTIAAAIGALGGAGVVQVRDIHTEGPLTVAGLTGALTIESIDSDSDPATRPRVREIIIDATSNTTIDGLAFGVGAGGFAVLYTGNAGQAEHTISNSYIDTDGGGNGIEVSGAPGNAGIVVNIDNTTIDGNGANGIGVFQQATINISGVSTISNNGAAGIAVFGAGTSLSLNGTNVTGNNTEGVWINASNCIVQVQNANLSFNGFPGFSNNGTENLVASFEDSTFFGNGSPEFGAGLRLFGNAGTMDGDVTITRCEIRSNNSPSDGAGIYVSNGIDLTVTNTLVAGNNSGNFSGGLRAVDSNVKAVHCTFADNTGVPFGGAPDGVSVESNANPVSAYFVNCIFSGHDSAIEGGYGSGTANFFLLNNLFDDVRGGDATSNVFNFGPNAVVSDVGSINDAADFVAPTTPNYRLNTTSPALLAAADQGAADAEYGPAVISMPFEDLGLDPRPAPMGTTADIGAYEEQTFSGGASVSDWGILND